MSLFGIIARLVLTLLAFRILSGVRPINLREEVLDGCKEKEGCKVEGAWEGQDSGGDDHLQIPRQGDCEEMQRG